VPKGFKKILTITVICLLFFAISTPVQSYLNLPNQQKLSVGDNLTLGLNFPKSLSEQLSIQINDSEGILNLSESFRNDKKLFNFTESSPVALEPGQLILQLKLFGFIPLKKINVDVIPNIKVYPGGQAVGVLLRTQGVLVVGQSPIVDEEGKAHFPAKEAGIKTGDSIIKINDHNIQTDDQLAKLINELGQKHQKIILSIKRNNNIFSKELMAIYCVETNTYRIGLFVRDNAGGVGTLTFYDPISKKYGALGHMISDSDTNQKINIKKGKLVKASIEGIQKGKKGLPGEKVGVFVENSDMGNIEVNSFCGIFGTLTGYKISNDMYKKPLAVGFANQVKTGSAQILTTLEGQKIEKFAINIERVMPGRRDGKEMVIKIIDPKLLKITGGIIQGMSGSPIIQNGKIIGAITHVFINDPTRGYGILIEDMLIEAGILNQIQVENLGA